MNCNVEIMAVGTADGLEVSIHGGSVGMMTAAELIVARVLMEVADDEKNLSDLKDSMFEIINEMVNVPCPECGAYQPFLWENVKFDKDDLDKGSPRRAMSLS